MNKPDDFDFDDYYDFDDDYEHTCEGCGRTENDSGQCPLCCSGGYAPGSEQCDFCEYDDECAEYTYGKRAQRDKGSTKLQPPTNATSSAIACPSEH